ncbi:MAG: response regulator [Verrucomicrobiota bacterium]|jgi:PAS domain S-box-containing protein
MNNPTPTRNNRILVIDDNPSIHQDIRKILNSAERDTGMEESRKALFGATPPEEEQVQFQVESALQGEEGLRKIQAAAAAGAPYAMAFVDGRMPPGWDGVETIARIWKQFPDLQVVICTAYSDYSWEEMVRQIGKSDSLLILKKPFDNIEVLQLAHALTQKWTLNHQVTCRLNDLDGLVTERTSQLQTANEQLKKEIAERLRAEQALRLSEERFSKAFKASPIPLAIQSLLDEKYVDANQGFLSLTGYSRDELIGQTAVQLRVWADPAGERAMLERLRKEMTVRNLQCHFRAKTGRMLDILLSVEVIELDGKPFLLIIALDITEQIRLETQLRQVQKMEAVGQLAAGVAHDFNNILTVVQGDASLLLARTPATSDYTRPLRSISAAADRAGTLVRQLLTFSRKQQAERRPVNIADTLRLVSDMLPRVLTEIININVLAPPELPHVSADAAMMETMLMNLAVNARDAMPDGGVLTIAAETVEISSDAARSNPEGQPGRFVRLSVGDTGCGIPAEILPRIFEPFFTTKPVGKGTGLGLATVYGIARQHQGWVEVHSQLNKGTTFHVFIPVLEVSESGQKAGPGKSATPVGGKETILVVEDEPDLRDLVVQVLESCGYNVLSAASGTQALQTWAKRDGPVDLLLTDMVMPDGLTGRKLAERLTHEDPSLRVIYTSGYTAGVPGTELATVQPESFLPKPYRPATLVQVVRECLDRKPSGASLAQQAA